MVGLGGPVEDAEGSVGIAVTVFCELVIEGARLFPLLGKAEIVICDNECAEVWLPETVANVRLGF